MGKVVDSQFAEAGKIGSGWIEMKDENLPKTTETMTVNLVGRGMDSLGVFILSFQHFAESDCAATHRMGGIKHFMPEDVFRKKWPDLFPVYEAGVGDGR